MNEEPSASLQWVNEVLKVLFSLTKLNLGSAEELASGAVLCQVLDVIYDGMVPMQKVNWASDKTSDFLSNFDILSNSLQKFQVQKELNIERLISGERQELLALLDWLKVFSLSNRNLGVGYDPVARRGGKEPSTNYVEKLKLKNQETSEVMASHNSNKENILAPRVGQGLDPKTVQKLAKFDLMKSERDFYYTKLKDIDHVLDLYKDANVETLIQTLRDILYLAPDKSGVVSDQGSFKVMGEGTKFDQSRNIAANFANDDELGFGGSMEMETAQPN